MNMWTLFSTVICLALSIYLVLFTYCDRVNSRFIYRVVLFLVTIYAGHEVMMGIYQPYRQVTPWLFFFHVALFVGSVLLKAEHLPWNHPNDAPRNRNSDTRVVTRRVR